MTEMEERVLRAVVAAIRRQEGEVFIRAEEGGIYTVDGHVDLEAVAWAVIAAMREPTEAMADKGAVGSILCAYDAGSIWRAMIDAALGLGPREG